MPIPRRSVGSRARADELVEGDGGDPQSEVGRKGTPGNHGHLPFPGPVPDDHDLDGLGAGGDAAEQVASVGIGQRPDPGTRDTDAGSVERLARGGVRDDSGHGSGLRGKAAGSTHTERECESGDCAADAVAMGHGTSPFVGVEVSSPRAAGASGRLGR